MVLGRRKYPGILRAFALLAGIVAIATVTARMNSHIDWLVAVPFGITLGIAMRWPIIMPRTGARVVLLSGLLIHALWYHGLPTALILLLVEFGVRMVALSSGRYYWEWYRPLIIIGALLGALGLAIVAGGESLAHLHLPVLPHNESSMLVLVYAFWGLLNAAWCFMRAPRHGRHRSQEYWLVIHQTWWVPLIFALGSYLMMLLHNFGGWAQYLTCGILLWIQSRVGPAFTSLYQDRAIANMVRQLPQSPAQRQLAQRVMQLAHTLARVVGLSAHDTRLVTYAALVQDHATATGDTVPLWTLEPLTQEEQAAIRQHVTEAYHRVENEGVLQEVAEIVRLRYAAHDGSGYPSIAADAIPRPVQVLTAANAVAVLTQTLNTTPAHAVAWIQKHAAHHFSPSLLTAMSHAFEEAKSTADLTDGLPETVRQLKGLVGTSPNSDWMIGFRRVWMELRGQIPLVPELPDEVKAAGRIATFFAASTDTETTAQVFVDAVGQLLGAKTALAMTENPSTNALSMRFVAASGLAHVDLKGKHTTILAGQMSRAIMDQEPVQVADLMEMNSALAHELAETEGMRSLLFVPLVARRRTIGLLIVGTQSYHWFTPREVGLINLLAGQAATALENARLIAEAEERIEHISNLKTLTDTLLDNLSTCILVVDPEGRLIMANRVAYKLFRTVPLEVGHPLPDEVRAAFPSEEALVGDFSDEVDVEWGSTLLQVQSIPLRDGFGAMLGAILLARDVTRVRAMEQQVRRVEKLAAIGELAAGAAHEIRNPLTAIRGFIQLLNAKASNADGDYFKIILSEIDRIDGIIHDLLLLARPSELQRQETRLDELVDEVLLLHQSEFTRQGITVHRHFDRSLGDVPIDRKMFRQLLLNLIINAAQAMPYGGRLTLTLRPADEASVALAVSDTGVGISSENLRRLFVPFFTTKEEGTGLGLALCYSIVQAHNGRIDVESKVGVGTTFTITLPTR